MFKFLVPMFLISTLYANSYYVYHKSEHTDKTTVISNFLCNQVTNHIEKTVEVINLESSQRTSELFFQEVNFQNGDPVLCSSIELYLKEINETQTYILRSKTLKTKYSNIEITHFCDGGYEFILSKDLNSSFIQIKEAKSFINGEEREKICN